MAGRGDAAGGVKDHGGAVTAVDAREHVAQRSRVRRRVAASELRRITPFDPEV